MNKMAKEFYDETRKCYDNVDVRKKFFEKELRKGGGEDFTKYAKEEVGYIVELQRFYAYIMEVLMRG